jgi:tetratricopeptide (TPR) repeat protein
MTEQRWDAALGALRTADQKYAIFDKYAFVLFAQAHDLAGHADSAIYYFEKFAAVKDPNISEDSQFLPGTYRRLGELYEAKGNTVKAVENYDKFVDLWKNAEPEMQPQVQVVREKIAKLAPVEKARQ